MIKLAELIKELSLGEGLTKTYEITKSLNNLNRQWSLNGKIFYEEIDETIRMIVREPIDKDTFDAILNHINNVLGYFPAHIITTATNFKYSYEEALKLLGSRFGIYFDAKYDREQSYKKLPDTLYHITPSVNDVKIGKIGLAPKNKNKMSVHPPRIYLADNAKSAMGLLTNPEFTIDADGNKIHKYTLYEIDMREIKLDADIIFYFDPQYVRNGIYTNDNIPPKYLTVIRNIEI